MDIDSEKTALELKILSEIKDFEDKTGKVVGKVSLCGDPYAVVIWLLDEDRKLY